MHSTTLPALDEFVDKRTLLPVVKDHLATEQSVNWFVRCHREQLADNGALILVAGRLRFHPARFKQSVVEIGARAAGAGIE
jgi:hypothetical protein